MSASNFTYFYELANYDTGNFLIQYNFANLTGGANIPSVSGAQPQYSGTLSSVGNFYQVPGSGYFTGQKLTINNSTGQSFEDFSMGFVFEKTATGNALLFSSLAESNQIYSGFNLGVNDANQVFFETFDNNGPKILTSSLNFSAKNILFLSKSSSALSFCRYDANLGQFDVESFSVVSRFVSPSDGWAIAAPKQQIPWASNSSFVGYIDNFIYLDFAILPASFETVISGFFTTGIVRESYSGTFCETGITGYFTGLLPYYSGITGYSVTSSTGDNYTLPTNTQWSFVDYSGLSGYRVNFVESGTDSYGQPTFTQNSGIFNFNYLDIQGSSSAVPQFTTSGFYNVQPLTGTLFSSGVLALSGEICETFETGFALTYLVDQTAKHWFGKETVSYLNRVEPSGFAESFVYTGQNNLSNYNLFGAFSSNEFGQGLFSVTPENNNFLGQFYLNGLSQYSGENYVTGNIYSSGYVLEDDFVLVNNQFLDSTGFYSDQDSLIYDIVTPNLQVRYKTEEWEQLESFWSGTLTDWSGEALPFPSGNLATSFVFCNGQKMSKSDYLLSGNSLIVENPVFAQAGVIDVWQQATWDTGYLSPKYLTISGTSGHHSYPNRFVENSSQVFLNGVRQKINTQYI